MHYPILRTGPRPAWGALITALVFIFIAPLTAQAIVAGSVGAVVKVRGEAHITRGAADLPAAEGAAIETHDTLRTGEDARLRIAFIDGSIVTLSENTTVSVDRFSESAEKRNVILTALNGVVSAMASKSAQSQFDYQIRSPNAYSTVRGTRWIVDVRSGATSFHVLEGLVEVGNATGNRTLVPAGRSVTFADGGSMGPVESTPPEDLQRLLNATELASAAPQAPAPVPSENLAPQQPQKPADSNDSRRGSHDAD
jgi:hypothetical protein